MEVLEQQAAEAVEREEQAVVLFSLYAMPLPIPAPVVLYVRMEQPERMEEE